MYINQRARINLAMVGCGEFFSPLQIHLQFVKFKMVVYLGQFFVWLGLRVLSVSFEERKKNTCWMWCKWPWCTRFFPLWGRLQLALLLDFWSLAESLWTKHTFLFFKLLGVAVNDGVKWWLWWLLTRHLWRCQIWFILFSQVVQWTVGIKIGFISVFPPKNGLPILRNNLQQGGFVICGVLAHCGTTVFTQNGLVIPAFEWF